MRTVRLVNTNRQVLGQRQVRDVVVAGEGTLRLLDRSHLWHAGASMALGYRMKRSKPAIAAEIASPCASRSPRFRTSARPMNETSVWGG